VKIFKFPFYIELQPAKARVLGVMNVEVVSQSLHDVE